MRQRNRSQDWGHGERERAGGVGHQRQLTRAGGRTTGLCDSGVGAPLTPALLASLTEQERGYWDPQIRAPACQLLEGKRRGAEAAV